MCLLAIAVHTHHLETQRQIDPQTDMFEGDGSSRFFFVKCTVLDIKTVKRAILNSHHKEENFISLMYLYKMRDHH